MAEPVKAACAGAGEQRVEPMLEQEQLEVAPRPIERLPRANGREPHARAASSSRTRNASDRRPRADSAVSGSSSSSASIAPAAAPIHSVDRALRGEDASGGERLELARRRAGGELRRARPRRPRRPCPPSSRGAQRVAGEPRLRSERARRAEAREHRRVVEDDAMRHRRAQSVRRGTSRGPPPPAGRRAQVDPHRQRRLPVLAAGRARARGEARRRPSRRSSRLAERPDPARR